MRKSSGLRRDIPRADTILWPHQPPGLMGYCIWCLGVMFWNLLLTSSIPAFFVHSLHLSKFPLLFGWFPYTVLAHATLVTLSLEPCIERCPLPLLVDGSKAMRLWGHVAAALCLGQGGPSLRGLGSDRVMPEEVSHKSS